MAVDGMMVSWENAANYKGIALNRALIIPYMRLMFFVRYSLSEFVHGLSWDGLPRDFDRAANSMYNQGFPRVVRGRNESRVRFSMYAVIKTGGKQYKVAVGEKLKVEQIPADIDAEITLDQVLAVGEGESIKFGTPLVSGASVKATVVSHGRHAKVTIFKMRRRKHYQKHGGHRQNYTELRIDAITA